MPTSLGPFELTGVLARGGMGQVWQGKHRGSQAPVAVKVLTNENMRGRRALVAFREEVRAMAGLEHPGVVRIHDYGELPAPAAQSLSVPVGSPYLVMELARGGALDRVRVAADFDELRGWMVSLLEILAHAHARGVVHRDLKPANILIDEGQIKLSDFGLAYALEGEATEDLSAAGTPEYMAPEQCHGAWRDFGPWTDLYALGCVAHSLACGAPPFSGRPMEIMLDKLSKPFPAMMPAFPVPSGFARWVNRLTAREPSERYRCAADASWGLWALTRKGGTLLKRLGPATQSWGVEDTAVSGPVELESGDSLLPTAEGLALPPNPQPSLPPTWRIRQPAESPPILMDAGLTLFGLRALPPIGRPRERDILWTEVKEMVQTGESRVVVLRGAAGTGKSHLARWLGQRAHEVGVASVLVAQHTLIGSPTEGLAAMIARHLRVNGLSRQALVARLYRLLGDDEEVALSLAELVAPASDEERASGERLIRFASLAERFGVVAGLLERLSLERPLLVVLEDVQWSVEALDFAERLLDRAGLAALLVLTVREEALLERPVEARLLAELSAKARVKTLPLGPLPPDEHRRLVRTLLPLASSLEDRVVERTAGSPQFAVELVRDWLERALLIATPDGYALPAGHESAVPASLQSVWSFRLKRFFSGRPAEDRRAMELAATLGMEIAEREWDDACTRARAWVSPALVDELLRAHMVRPRADGAAGFVFAHPMLRETLEQEAEAAGRAAEHHRICAQVVSSQPKSNRQEARVGRHLLASGEPESALGPLAVAARQEVQEGALSSAEVLLASHAQASAKAGLGLEDPRRLVARLLKARVDLGRGRVEEAQAEAAWIAAAAGRQGVKPIRVEALAFEGRVHFERMTVQDGLVCVDTALAELGSLPEPGLRAECFKSAGMLHAAQADFDGAHQLHTEARRLFIAAGRPVDACMSLLSLGRMCKQRGRLEEARQLTEKARDRLHELGARVGEADALHDLGELARLSGALDEAETFYRAARERYEALGSADAAYAELNLAIVLLERGHVAEAAPLFERVRALALRQGRRVLVMGAELLSLVHLAKAETWDLFDDRFMNFRWWQSENGLAEVDFALAAERAADAALSMGQAERATAAYQLANEQWLELKRPAERARVEEKQLALKGRRTAELVTTGPVGREDWARPTVIEELDERPASVVSTAELTSVPPSRREP